MWWPARSESHPLRTWLLRLGGAAALFVGSATHGFAARPLTIDDTEPVPCREFQLEAGTGYNADRQLTHYDFPLALNYGLVPGLQIGLGSGGQIEEREEVELGRRIVRDVGDLTAGAKWMYFGAKQIWPSQAVAFTTKFPTASHSKGLGTGKMDYDLTWILSKPIADRWNAHLNVGYTWTGDHPEEDHADLLHYGVALDCQITRSVQLVAEVFASMPDRRVGDTAVMMNGGARWQVTERLVFDVAVGGGLSDGAPAVTATMGVTWSFGLAGKNNRMPGS